MTNRTTGSNSARAPTSPLISSKHLAAIVVAGLCLLWTAGCSERVGKWVTPRGGGDRSLVLITVGTLRADRLGCYGALRPATPRIDFLARTGALFEDVLAVAPITLPAHASIMTGRYPVAHGVRDNVSYVLSEEETTLAETLRARGFRTAAFVGAFPVASQFGLGQGFEVYDEAFDSAGVFDKAAGSMPLERRASEVDRSVLPWLEKTAASGESFFLWVHYYDPHFPYEPPPHLAALYAGAPYAGEVAAVDEAVGVLLDALERSGAAKRTAVLLTADHGEALGEHGEPTHSYFVYQATVRVPLIVSVPWILSSPRRIGQVVSQVDLMPTALDLLGARGPTGMQGRSLVPLIEGKPLQPLPVMGECIGPWAEFRFSPLRMLRDAKWKYIDAPRPELYDIAADPDETANLAGTNSEQAKRFQMLLRGRFAAAKDEAAALSVSTATDEDRQKLASLGYAGRAAGASLDPVPEPSAALRDPKDGGELVARFDRSMYELTRGNYSQAVESLRALGGEFPESPSVKEQLGEALLMAAGAGSASEPAAASGQRALLVEASEVLRKLVSIEPRYAAAHMKLGRALEMLDEKEQAIEEYRTAAKLSSAAASARVLLGRLLFRTGKSDEAIEEIRRGVAAAPDTVPFRRTLVSMFESSGREREAEEVMMAYTRLRPEDPRSWNELGGLQLRHRDLAGAGESFRHAARLDPRNAVARMNLGSLFLISGKLKDSEKEYRAALEAAPDLVQPRLELARVLLYEGRESEGRQLLDEVESRFPSESRVHSYWGLYLAKVKGDRERALASYQRALAINPRDPIATEGTSGRR